MLNLLFLEKTFLLILLIFIIGMVGVVLNRHNIIILLLSFEVMYLSSTLMFAFYSYESGSILGLVYILFVLTNVGAEACIGLAIVSFYYSISKEINLNELSLTKL